MVLTGIFPNRPEGPEHAGRTHYGAAGNLIAHARPKKLSPAGMEPRCAGGRRADRSRSDRAARRGACLRRTRRQRHMVVLPAVQFPADLSFRNAVCAPDPAQGPGGKAGAAAAFRKDVFPAAADLLSAALHRQPDRQYGLQRPVRRTCGKHAGSACGGKRAADPAGFLRRAQVLQARLPDEAD